MQVLWSIKLHSAKRQELIIYSTNMAGIHNKINKSYE